MRTELSRPETLLEDDVTRKLYCYCENCGYVEDGPRALTSTRTHEGESCFALCRYRILLFLSGISLRVVASIVPPR